jgi:hypothetical protein
VPIDFDIDHERRLVTARGRGTVSYDDVYSYQLQVWGKADVVGYDELVDMSGVEEISIPSMDSIPRLASLSAQMDSPDVTSKLAIVVKDDFAFALGRMYETYRGLDPRSTKQARVFRSLPEALAYLGPRTPPSVPQS